MLYLSLKIFSFTGGDSFKVFPLFFLYFSKLNWEKVLAAHFKIVFFFCLHCFGTRKTCNKLICFGVIIFYFIALKLIYASESSRWRIFKIEFVCHLKHVIKSLIIIIMRVLIAFKDILGGHMFGEKKISLECKSTKMIY